MPASVNREYFNFTRHGIEAPLVSAGVKTAAITAQGGLFCVLGSLLHGPVKVYHSFQLPKELMPALPLFCRVAFELKGVACFRAIDHLDTNQHSRRGWRVCAGKSDH